MLFNTAMFAPNVIVLLTLISTLGHVQAKKQIHVYAGKNQKLDWESAFNYCQQKGMNLVTTQDWEAHDQAEAAITMCSKHCDKHISNSWTAANDLDEDWNFVWKGINKKVDMKMKNWQRNQPDHYRNNEHCVVLWFPLNKSKGPVYLNDRPCGECNNVICEAND